MKILILQGIPGSGKSTWAKENFPEAVVCSADHYFMEGDRYVYDKSKLKDAHDACLRKFISEITSNSKGSVVIVDNTNIQRWEMATYVLIARAYNREVEVHTFLIDPREAFKRGTHNVPLPQLIRAAAFMDSPMAMWGKHVWHLPDGVSWSTHPDEDTAEEKNPLAPD